MELEPSRERTVVLKDELRNARSTEGPRLPPAPMIMMFLMDMVALVVFEGGDMG